MTGNDELRPSDAAIDRELADIASNIRFLLDVTPINLIEARTGFLSEGTAPDFVYARWGTTRTASSHAWRPSPSTRLKTRR